MKMDAMRSETECRKERRRKKIFKRGVALLVVAVLLCAENAMILPTTAMETGQEQNLDVPEEEILQESDMNSPEKGDETLGSDADLPESEDDLSADDADSPVEEVTPLADDTDSASGTAIRSVEDWQNMMKNQTGEYDLEADLNLTKDNKGGDFTGEMTLDLNGHTIKFTGADGTEGSSDTTVREQNSLLVDGGNLTIKDSSMAIASAPYEIRRSEPVKITELKGDMEQYGKSGEVVTAEVKNADGIVIGKKMTITYFVTESERTQNGRSVETLYKHTVTVTYPYVDAYQGTIEGKQMSDAPLRVKNGGTLNIEGGKFLSDGHRVIYAENDTVYGDAVDQTKNVTLNLSGGVFSGAKNGGIQVNGGTVNMSGGIVKNNRSSYNGGGMILRFGSTLNLSGGVIESNSTSQSGGGIYLDSGTTLNMEGGVISHNTAGGKSDSTVKQNADGTVISGGGGAIAAQTARLNISGGLITENEAKDNSGGGIYVVSEKNLEKACSVGLNITGGYIAGNKTPYEGGGIYFDGGYVPQNESFVQGVGEQITISGGVVSGNEATGGCGICGWRSKLKVCDDALISGNRFLEGASDTGRTPFGNGGGVYAGWGSFVMDGGYITNNRMDYCCDKKGHGDHGGGGVYAKACVTTISDGVISGNYHGEAGGGFLYFYGENVIGCKFMMTGGAVVSNIADVREGGGLNIQGGENNEIKAADINKPVVINNNRTNTTWDWGGGGIFIVQGSVLEMDQAVIAGNDADGFGGGVAGCPTGQVLDFEKYNDGVAMFENQADGVEMSGDDSDPNSKPQDLTAQNNPVFMESGYQDFMCALSSIVSNSMLGGGIENWHGSSDYKKIDHTLSENEALSASSMMGLSANPTAENKQNAYAAAKVFITGNHSGTHGGGITTNGICIFGNTNGYVELSPGLQIIANKTLIDSSDNEKSPDLKEGQFTFLLMDEKPVLAENSVQNEEHIIDRVENSQNGSNNGYIQFYLDYGSENLTFAGSDLETTKTYYLLEDEEGVGTGIECDKTVYRLDVTIEKRTEKKGNLTITYYVVTDVNATADNGETPLVTKENLGKTDQCAVVMIQKGDQTDAFVNHMTRYELPEAGGLGIARYMLAGALLAVGAFVLLVYKCARQRKEEL